MRRAFAGVDLRDLDPFLHMDQMGEVDYAPGEPKGTPWHPHRGFDTVTYMIDGQMQHADSHGGGGLISGGDTQWMTAGAGILHIETPPEYLVASGGLFHGFQLWVNLPRTDKMTKPRYQDVQGDKIPEIELGPGARARVLVGTVNGTSGPVDNVATEPVYFDLHLEPNASYTADLPPGHNAFAYVYQGEAKIGAAALGVARGELALLTHGEALPVTAGSAGARLIVVAARPLNEPVARYGPFVMNTPDEIRQAFADYQAGRL